MTELEQLKADLATIQNAAKIAKTLGYPDRSGNYDMVGSELKEKIADIEAQKAPADEWAGVKVIIADWLNHPYNTHIQGISLKKFANYVHHLESKVADLKHELRCERIDGGKVRDDLRAEIAAKDSKAYLGDFRVLKTAQDIAEYSEKSENGRDKLILCRNLVAAISDFTLHVRLWGGLHSLDPYKWSSLGLYDEHLIDRKDGGKVRDDRKAISAEQNRQELAELTTIANAIPPACGLARELVERRIEGVKREMQA